MLQATVPDVPISWKDYGETFPLEIFREIIDSPEKIIGIYNVSAILTGVNGIPFITELEYFYKHDFETWVSFNGESPDEYSPSEGLMICSLRVEVVGHKSYQYTAINGQKGWKVYRLPVLRPLGDKGIGEEDLRHHFFPGFGFISTCVHYGNDGFGGPTYRTLSLVTKNFLGYEVLGGIGPVGLKDSCFFSKNDGICGREIGGFTRISTSLAQEKGGESHSIVYVSTRDFVSWDFGVNRVPFLRNGLVEWGRHKVGHNAPPIWINPEALASIEPDFLKTLPNGCWFHSLHGVNKMGESGRHKYSISFGLSSSDEPWKLTHLLPYAFNVDENIIFSNGHWMENDVYFMICGIEDAKTHVFGASFSKLLRETVRHPWQIEN